jgi:hypothetical protein
MTAGQATQLEILTLAKATGWRKREQGYSLAWRRAFALTRRGQKVIVEFDADGHLSEAVTAGHYVDTESLVAALKEA